MFTCILPCSQSEKYTPQNSLVLGTSHYLRRGGREKRRGVKAVSDWLEEGLFFTINRGGYHFLGFATGLVCAFANVITFTK